jgi:transcription elongation factor GreA
MDQGKIYVTKQRLSEIEEEVRRLKVHGRKEVAQRIAEARAQGDLSENAEYDAAREEQGLLELRIKKMEEILTRSSIFDETNVSTDKVGIMSKVTVTNEKTGKDNHYQIVSQEEADFDTGRISMSSPIGKALMGKKPGESVQVKVPAGVLNLKVKEITK